MISEIKYDRDGVAIRDNKAPEMTDTTSEAIPVVEAAAPEVETVEQVEAAEVDHVHDDEPVVEEPAPKSSATNAANIRTLRERAERADRAERERDEALNYIRQMQSAAQPQQQKEHVEEDYSINLGENDLAEGKHLSKVQKQIKALQDELTRVKQQSTNMTVETRLKMQYPDIEQVLSNENIQQLRQQEPELAYTIGSNQDIYSQQVAAYKLIKKLGIHRDTSYDAEKDMIKKNVSKPKPVVSLNPQQGDSPLSRANAFAQGLTPDLKKQLAKEMADIRRNS